MSISALRQKSANMADKIMNFQKENQKKKYSDDVETWSPFLDKEKGMGEAVFRFLPPVDGEEIPYALTYRNSFKNPTTKKWFINVNPRTIGLEDPVYHLTNRLYETEDKEKKEFAGKIKSKTEYYANVYVISHPARPQDEGKVFLYRFGTSIMKLIEAALQPKFSTDPKFNPFDPFTGANFNFRAVKDGKGEMNWDYSGSRFDVVSELFPGRDDLVDVVHSQCKPLLPLKSESRIKSYDKLAEELVDVLGLTVMGIPTLDADYLKKVGSPLYQKYFGGPTTPIVPTPAVTVPTPTPTPVVTVPTPRPTVVPTPEQAPVTQAPVVTPTPAVVPEVSTASVTPASAEENDWFAELAKKVGQK